jgi:hypothetical protein
MLENRMLRRMFGLKRYGPRGGSRRLRNLCSSPSIIRMMKLKSIRWTGHVAQIGRRGIYGHQFQYVETTT